MIYSASQAGKVVGKSTATITRAIEKGSLSATKDGNGAWQIDASELHRVFAPASPATHSVKRDEKDSETRTVGGEAEKLRERLAEAERRAAVAEAQAEERARHLDDLSRRLDAETEERRKLTAVLMAPPSEPPAPRAAPRPRRQWPWTRG